MPHPTTVIRGSGGVTSPVVHSTGPPGVELAYACVEVSSTSAHGWPTTVVVQVHVSPGSKRRSLKLYVRSSGP
ncbi:hypothetical protein [Microbacterium kunmingense]|uniref:hypothetical protein n=1 Tax=Microbacterium kunmingense TaxID=2915939 RepID=UPI003D72E4F4